MDNVIWKHQVLSTGTYFEKNVSNWNWIYTKSSYR